MNWRNVIVVVSLLLNIMLVVFNTTNRVQGAGIVNIPVLPKDNGYIISFNESNRVTCVELENYLGLKRGDVDSITRDNKGNTIIAFSKGLILDAIKISDTVNKMKGNVPNISTQVK
jgi:hypothetical protein